MSLKKGFHAQANTATVTVPNSQERLDQIAKARFQGEKFLATMGGHAATNEMFKGKLLKWKRQERALVLKEKASRLAAEKLEGEVLAIIESLGDDDKKKKLKVLELQKLLLFYGIERKKQAKGAVKMREQYKELKEKNAAPKAYKKWTEADEANLEWLKNETITIEETELGKERAKLRKQQKDSLIGGFQS